MALPRPPAPTPFLLDRRYWLERLTRMETVGRGLLLLPRADLTSPFADVVEWRMKAHDGLRLWGLRGLNPFRPEPPEACVQAVDSAELPEIQPETLAEGCVQFVYQVPAGRRLEDRVLDLLRVVQLAMTTCDLPLERVRLVADLDEAGEPRRPDELMIAERLLREGFLPVERKTRPL